MGHLSECVNMTLPGRYVPKRWHPAPCLDVYGSASGAREIITVPALALEIKLMGLSLYTTRPRVRWVESSRTIGCFRAPGPAFLLMP